MQITAQQLLMLMQVSDSAFPTGAFTHSNGLETFVQQGVVYDASTLQTLIETQLENLCHSDMIIIHAGVTAYQAGDEARLIELDQLLTAAKQPQESREASVKIGRRMLQSVVVVFPDEMLLAYQYQVQRGDCAGHQAIVYGLSYAAFGMSAHEALLAYAFNIVAGQVSAAVKLMSMGQTQAQQVIHALQPTMLEAVDQALTMTIDDFHSFTPALDIRAMQHQHLFRRLFIS